MAALSPHRERSGRQKAQPAFFAGGLQLTAEEPVGRNAARNHERFRARVARRQQEAAGEALHHGTAVGSRQIRDVHRFAALGRVVQPG